VVIFDDEDADGFFGRGIVHDGSPVDSRGALGLAGGR
jgi:hypothetical protein